MRISLILVPLFSFAVAGSSLSQEYRLEPRDLVDGYRIVDGGTVTVEGGAITQWDVAVDGAVPFTFSSELPGHSVLGDVAIGGASIDFDMTPQGAPEVFRFDAVFLPGQPGCGLPSPVGNCIHTLDWFAAGIPGITDQSGVRYSVRDGSGLLVDITLDVEEPGSYLVASVVPEPNGLFLTLMGIGVLGVFGRRRDATSGRSK